MKAFTDLKIKFFFVFIMLIISDSLLSQPDIKLSDISSAIGLDSAYGSRIAIVDVNNDNYPDLLWGTGNAGKNQFHLYLNIPNPDVSNPNKRIYKDITEESGINANRDPKKKGRVIDVAAMADVNNDGYIDLVTSIYYHRLEYYKDSLDPGDRSEVLLNDGTGHFKLVENSGLNTISVIKTFSAGLINATGMCFLDYDFDGNIDIYIPTWFSDRANGIGMPDVLLKGNGDGTFTQIKLPPIEGNFYPMYGANVTDWDNDGWPDVLTSPYCNSRGNLFRNMQDGTFQDYAVQANYNAQDKTGDNGQALCQWEAQPGDFNNDGNMDILQVLVHGGMDPGEGHTHVSLNNGPDSGFKFTPLTNALKRDEPASSHLGDQGGEWFDFDSDGRLDVAIGQMAYPQANMQGQERLYILYQANDTLFNDISKSASIYYTIKEAHSMEPVDFDLDGDQDLFVSHQKRDTTIKDTIINGKAKKDTILNTYMRVRLLHNNRKTSVDTYNSGLNNWLEMKLDPPKGCNRSAIGARITVHIGKYKYMQEVQAGLGHFSGQQSFIRYMGLGKATVADSVTIRWPRKDLKVTTIKTVPLNTIIIADTTGIKGFISPTNSKKALIALSPRELNFDTVRVGTTKDMKFKIYNFGDTALNVQSVGIPTNFTLQSPAFPIEVKPGEQNAVEVTLRFAPALRKDYSTLSHVTSNCTNFGVFLKPTVFFNAIGFTEQPLISASNALDFDTVYTDTSKIMDLIIKNTGESPLDITKLEILNSNTTFTIVKDITPITIQAGKQITVQVLYKPIKETTDKNALRIFSNGYNEQVTYVGLSAVAENRRPRISSNVTMLMMGSILVGSTSQKTLTLRNDGTGTLIIDKMTYEKPYDSIYTWNDFAIPYSIPPRSARDITIEFKPLNIMSYRTDVFLHSNSFTDSSYKITLVGTGKDPNSVAEEIDGNGYSVTVSPNPSSENVEIKIKNIQNAVSVKIIDIMGNIVQDYPVNYSSNSENQYLFETSNCASGVYFAVISNNIGMKAIPIIIKK